MGIKKYMETASNLKFIFFGTPALAAETLEILKRNGYTPSLVVTAPDKPVGRKQIITPPPVKVWAIENNIPYLQPEKLDINFLKKSFDLFIVVAYGKIFPEWLINSPKFGTLNIHYSLLPEYRGASPVQTAILNGKKETGVTIQKMVKVLDAGPIVGQKKIEIEQNEKTTELLERLTKIGGEFLIKILPDYLEGKIILKEQDETKTTFCQKIKKEDGLIDLNGNPISNYNKFRAFYEWPRTYFIKNEKRIIITDATFENEEFKITKVLPEGKKEIKYEEFIRN